MGFGAFDIWNFAKGDNNISSNDPNSVNYSGGSFNKAYDDTKLRSLAQYKVINRPYTFADKSGFMPYQYAGMNEMARNLFNNGSATAAANGMVSPQNYDAIVGSSLTRALPNLFQIQNENQMLPGQQAQQRLSLLQPMIQAGQASLGPGVGYNNINQGNSNWWNMGNNIGSFWGGGGGGKAAGAIS